MNTAQLAELANLMLAYMKAQGFVILPEFLVEAAAITLDASNAPEDLHIAHCLRAPEDWMLPPGVG